MRPLNDIHIPLGNLVVKTASQQTAVFVVPEKCEFVAASFNCEEGITAAAGDCDIFVNAADTAGVGGAAVDITFPVTATNLGGEVQPGAKVHLEAGDSFYLESNGSPTLGIIDITATFRR